MAPGSSPLRLSKHAAETIRAAVRLSGRTEACGLLFGDALHIATATVARNVAAEPWHRFEIDPAHLFEAHRAARAGPHALVGCWHSHPNGSPRPSAHDRAGVADMGWLWLIATADALTGWRPAPRGFAEVAIRLPDL